MFDFDLDAIDTVTGSVAGADLKLLDVRGEPFLNSKKEQHFITLLGPDSPQYQRAMHAQAMRRVQEAAKAAEDAKAAGTKPQAPGIDDAKANTIEVMAACTKAWNFLDRAGNPIPVSVEAARELLTRFPVIYDQADVFIARRANFLPAPSKA